jgi:hypothetical protein
LQHIMTMTLNTNADKCVTYLGTGGFAIALGCEYEIRDIALLSSRNIFYVEIVEIARIFYRQVWENAKRCLQSNE